MKRLETEDDILYHLEQARLHNLQQLRTKVIPPSLPQTVINALHTSPTTGHMCIQKIIWRVITRFWWPRLYLDVRNAVTQCTTCGLANNTDHKNQQRLRTVDTTSPFDIVFLDGWNPGNIPDRSRAKHILTQYKTVTSLSQLHKSQISHHRS